MPSANASARPTRITPPRMLYKSLNRIADPYNIRLAVGRVGGKEVIEQISRICDFGRAIKELTSNESIQRVLSLLYNNASASLFKDKIIYKPPGAKGALLHQDYAYWQGFPHSLLTVAIPMDDCSKGNDCTYLLSPRREQLLYVERILCIKSGQLNLDDVTPREMRRGDIYVFDCFTPRSSYDNGSNTSRRCFL